MAIHQDILEFIKENQSNSNGLDFFNYALTQEGAPLRTFIENWARQSKMSVNKALMILKGARPDVQNALKNQRIQRQFLNRMYFNVDHLSSFSDAALSALTTSSKILQYYNLEDIDNSEQVLMLEQGFKSPFFKDYLNTYNSRNIFNAVPPLREIQLKALNNAQVSLFLSKDILTPHQLFSLSDDALELLQHPAFQKIIQDNSTLFIKYLLTATPAQIAAFYKLQNLFAPQSSGLTTFSAPIIQCANHRRSTSVNHRSIF